MKYIFLLFLMVILNQLFSQDTSSVNPAKIYHVYDAYFLYKKKVVKENEVFSILNTSGDRAIMDLVKQSKNARRLKYIGFVSIPAALSALIFTEYSISHVYNRNGTTDNKKKSNYLAATGVWLFFVIACPTFSIIVDAKHKKLREKAVKLYNEKF